MKVVILAGGFGTRISEESHLRPKPMIEIGDKPILWHIMKEYSHYGYNEFVICCGYKQHMIKEYFADYYLYNGDVTFDFGNENKMIVHNNVSEPWKTSVYKGYKQDKIEMRGDRAEMSDFPLYLNTVAGGLDRRDQTIGGFSFVVKIYALPVVEIIGQLLYLLGRYGFNTQFGDCL